MNRCVVQLTYIIYLDAGLIQLPDNPYDDRPAEKFDRNNPDLWETEQLSHLHDVLPIPVHSHNDYQRKMPLFEALRSGCISVEADIHLHDSDLFVGHTTRELRDSSTVRSLYLEPLEDLLKAQNINVTDGSWKGLFNLAPQQTLVLLIDQKTYGLETFEELYHQLKPLRDLDYLTYWNGTERVVRPLTIVSSGNSPFQAVTTLNSTHRDIFWDAKLENLASANDNFDVEPVVYEYNHSNSYFASTKFGNAVFRIHSNDLPDTPKNKDRSATQIEQANARGLITRYWGTPSQPPNMREIVWQVLLEYRVGILNMDDMGTVKARAKEWRKIKPTETTPNIF